MPAQNPAQSRYARRQRRIIVSIVDAFGGGAGVVGSGSSGGGVGRVASRPGYPAEPAARSRPFGRVSLAPPLPSVAARSACPAAGCARRRCRNDIGGCVQRHQSYPPPFTTRVGAGFVPSPVTASPFTALRAAACDTGRPARVFPAPPATVCFAPLPAADAVLPTAQAPRRLPLAAFAGADFPLPESLNQNHPGRRRRLAFTPHAARCHWRHIGAWTTVSCVRSTMDSHYFDGKRWQHKTTLSQMPLITMNYARI